MQIQENRRLSALTRLCQEIILGDDFKTVTGESYCA